MTTKNIPISQIENNTGQVEGLPGNPRITNPVKLDKLVESIKQDPEMLQLRGLLVYPFADDKIYHHWWKHALASPKAT